MHFGIPNGYIHAEIENKSLFYKVYDKMNFIKAKEKCEQDGTSLAIPKSGKKWIFWSNNTIIFSEAENIFFSNLFNDGNTWIGIQKLQTSNRFVVINNSPLRFTQWLPFQPNFNGKSAAAFCSRDKCNSAEWEDKSIYDDANVICSFVIPGKMIFRQQTTN